MILKVHIIYKFDEMNVKLGSLCVCDKYSSQCDKKKDKLSICLLISLYCKGLGQFVVPFVYKRKIFNI